MIRSKLTFLLFLLLAFGSCKQKKTMSAGEIIAKDIYSTSWKLSEWYIEGNKIKIIGDKSYTLFFNSENNQIHGNSGCNRYFGKYELNGVTLKPGILPVL